MATAPCPFGRPIGMELVKKVLVERSPDLNLIGASAMTAHAKKEQYYRPRFWSDQPVGSRDDHYVDLLILAHPPCGPGRAHLSALTTWGNKVVIENYNLTEGKGTYYEFGKIWSYHVGHAYLFDLEREFPPDNSNLGEVIKARFSGDVFPAQLECQLKRRGYKLAVHPKHPICNRATRELSEFDPIWALPHQGLTNIRIVRISSTDYTYEPVGDIIPAGTYVMAEKIGVAPTCCRRQQYACKNGYECPLIGACEAY